MLYVDIGVTSSVVVTLYEKSLNQYNPFFTWHIISGDSKEQYVFYADDFSPSPWYYNAFTFSFTGGGKSDLKNGVVPAYSGQYYYTVYEMTRAGDLNLNHALGIAETGILNVVGTYSSITAFTQSDQNTVAVFKNILRM